MPLALALALTAAPTAFAQSQPAHHREATPATTTANDTIIPGVITPDPGVHDNTISPPTGLAADGTPGAQAVQWGRILGGVPGSGAAHGMAVSQGLPASRTAEGGPTPSAGRGWSWGAPVAAHADGLPCATGAPHGSRSGAEEEI